MPTKRKSSGDEGYKGKKRKDASSLRSSLFCKLSKEAGIVLHSDGKHNEINVNPAVFQRDLSQSLQTSNKNKIVDEFIEGLTKYLEDPSGLKSCLMMCRQTHDKENNSIPEYQDGIVRLLLGVDDLQPRLVALLLEKLLHVNTYTDTFTQGGTPVNVPHLIMAQLRWLEHIHDPEGLIEKLFEMLSLVSSDIQREIISCLPEIVDDVSHMKVGRQLIDLYNENSELTVPILDALSNLSLGDDVTADVKTSVLENLDSINLDDVPVAVRFILQTVTPKNAVEVIEELRGNLNLKSTFPPSDASTPDARSIVTKDRCRKDSSEALTFRAIESACSKHVEDAWIKVITDLKSPSDHKELDLIVLFIQYASPPRRKYVEGLLRNKIRSGAFTDVLLQATFSSFTAILRDKMNSVLGLCKVLLKSLETVVANFGCCMYKMSFSVFDTYYQQELISQLMGHIGSGQGVEVDCALDVLTDLTDNNIDKMKKFDVFVKSLLYYIDNYSLEQIRKLYYAVSQLGLSNSDDGNNIQDDVHIMLRKQLSNNDLKYRRMGVIGAVMMVKSTATNINSSTITTDSSLDGTISEEAYNQAISLLQLVRTCCKDVPEAMGLFLDEMANAMQKGHFSTKIETWVRDNLASDFENDYVTDYSSEKKNDEYLVPYDNQYALDDVTEGGDITVPVLPLVAKSLKTDKKKRSGRLISPLCLAPEFRLLRICEQRQRNGDLNEIGATLGCPVQLPQTHVYDKLSSLSQSERQLICSSLFTAVNWFIETVNAFSTQDDAEMKAKVLCRLQNISELRKRLEKCLALTPNYQPPMASYYSDPSPPVSIVTGNNGDKKKRSRKRKKKTKSDENKEDLDEDVTSKDSDDVTPISDDVTQKPVTSEQSGEGGSVDLTNYREYFRELDVAVFTTLRSDVTQASLDTEFIPKTPQQVQLQPEQLEYLLIDLGQKLDHVLLSSAPKRKSLLKKKVTSCFLQLDQFSPSIVAKRGVKLLPTLCDQLEKMSAYFQTMMTANDGLVDGPGSRSERSVMMGSCFHRLLHCILTLFSWTGFTNSEYSSLMKEMLISVSTRMCSSSATQIPHNSSIKYCFAYFENFARTIPNLKSAVGLTKLLMVLQDKAQSKQTYQEKIAVLCKGFLQQEWIGADGERQRGLEHNENLLALLTLYLTNSKDPMESIEQLTADGMNELSETDKNGASTTYPTLNRSTQAVFFKVMMLELIEVTKTYSLPRQNESFEVKRAKLLEWNICVRIFHALLSLCKVFDARTNLCSALKYGRKFLDLFLKQCMPMLDSMFRLHREDVQGLLKNLQLSTRNLQHICNHSKTVRDLALTNQVPLLKKTLEAFVYRVKAMLTVNKCLEAFWMGNLKNRTIHGEEIASQASRTNGADHDERNADSTAARSDDGSESPVETVADDSSSGGEDDVSVANRENPSLSQDY